MTTEERRNAILDTLARADQPVSAAALARRFGVSRQIVVGDVALLRAGGADISATPRGYVILPAASGLVRRLAVRHGEDGIEAELNAMVDQGCTVLDVIVEHPLYGQLTGPLQISNRYEVGQFLSRCRLWELILSTTSTHLLPLPAAFQRARQALRELGILLEE